MPRRVILHAGFHKTGTTSVQTFLRANRPALKKHVAIRLKPQMRDLLHATRAYSRDRDRATFDAAQAAFVRMLVDLPPMPRRTLILSAQDLSGRLPGQGKTVDYSAAADLLYGFVVTLRDRMPQSEPALYFSTRPPDDWLQSAYWEHVRYGAMTMELRDFIRTYARAGQLDAAVDEIAARVPCVTHRSALESWADQPLGPAGPLLDLSDVPAALRAKLIPPAHANPTDDITVLLQLLAANRTTDSDVARRKAKDAILARAGLT
jgi:hypothetical protein